MKNIVMLLFFFTISNYAQAPVEKVKEMIKEMNADKMITETLDRMIPVMQQQLSASLKTEKEKEKAAQINTILLDEVKQFTQDIINGPMVKIYAKYFTEKDIDELIEFYKSEIGKKMIKLTPTITGELMQDMMKNEMPKFQQRLIERIKQIKGEKE